MKPEDFKNIPFKKLEPNPLVKDMPKHLKDHANYDKIRLAVLDTFATGHSHSEMAEFAVCVHCTGKMEERRELLLKLGFKSPAQYMEWQKIHAKISDRVPLR